MRHRANEQKGTLGNFSVANSELKKRDTMESNSQEDINFHGGQGRIKTKKHVGNGKPDARNQSGHRENLNAARRINVAKKSISPGY